MAQPAFLSFLWRLIDEKGDPQSLPYEESRKIDYAYNHENTARPLMLRNRTFMINLKNQIATNLTNHQQNRLDQVPGTWSVLWNNAIEEKWRQLPWTLSHFISQSFRQNPQDPVELTNLFNWPGVYRFKLFEDVTCTHTLRLEEKELLDDFTADFPALISQGGTEVQIRVGEVRNALLAFQPLANGLLARFAGLPPGLAVFTKIYAAHLNERNRLLWSYSNKMYGWVRELFDDPTAEVMQKICFKQVGFINNVELMQRFTLAFEALDVTNNWPECPEAFKLETLCSEHDFLFCLRPRMALMMYVPDDDNMERAILSCGFSMGLNAVETIIGTGIPFTSNPVYAKAMLAGHPPQPAPAGANFNQGTRSVILSWVAIGEPYFPEENVPVRQPGCTTHFALTNNWTTISPQGDTPLLVSFEPKLCCPFAVAEFDCE